MRSSDAVILANKHYGLLAVALIAPLPLAPWLPAWDSRVYEHGIVTAVALCTAYAVIEEVIFRGMIQSWLLAKMKPRNSIFQLSRANLVTSTLFALAHLWQHPLWLFPGYFAVSLLFGHFRERYHGIWVPLALHTYYNLLLLFMPGPG